MSHADKLAEMVIDFTSMSENLSGSLVKIDQQIADLSAQWKAINYAQDGIEVDLETYVETNKSDYFYSYGSFGVSGTGELKEWMGFDEETGLSGLTYESANSFLVTGDETGTFTVGTSAVVTNGGSFSTSSTVSGSLFNLPWHAGQTLVVLYGSICQASLDGVYLESYANSGPLWDSDATVIAYMSNWAYLDNFVTQAVGLDGTYGIEGRLSNLYVARGVVENDYNKYTGMYPILDLYATP
jgi:hypothetical protein